MYGKVTQTPRPAQTHFKIHHIKFDKSSQFSCILKRGSERPGGTGQVQFKFKAKGSSFIAWHRGTRRERRRNNDLSALMSDET